MSGTFKTDPEVKAAKCPPGVRQTFLRDESEEGLRLYITTNGVKSWALYYRFEGRQRLLNLGRYPDTGLAEARGKARDNRKAATDPDKPVDPMAERQRKRDAPTFADLAKDYLERY